MIVFFPWPVRLTAVTYWQFPLPEHTSPPPDGMHRSEDMPCKPATTICPSKLVQISFYTHYMNFDKTSWTYSTTMNAAITV